MSEPAPRWPLVVALAAAAAWTVGLAARMRAAAEGHWTFPLDDTYIHLSLARTLVESGTWGLVPGEVATATSSPLWALLLAGALALHPVAWVAGALAATAGGLLLVAADGILRAAGLGPGARLLGLVGVALLTPLAPLVLQGMEHPLHAALAVAFLGRWSTRTGPGPVDPALVALAALASATRLETAFLLAVPVLERVARGRRAEAAALVGAAALPWGLMGAFGVAHGGFWLPNSVVVKSVVLGGDVDQARLWRVWANLARNARDAPELAVAAVALPVLPAGRAGAARRAAVAVAVLLHLGLGAAGWGGRYEAWLMALVGVVGAEALARASLRPGPGVALGLVALLGAWRAPALSLHAVGGAAAVWRMNVTLGRVAAHLPPDLVVASTDAGALTWFGRPRFVDLVGLGTTAVARRNVGQVLDGPAIGAIVEAHGAAMVVGWGRHLALRLDEVEIPAGWLTAGRLRLDIRAEDAWPVFWVSDPTRYAEVRAALGAVAPHLPAGAALELPDTVPVAFGSLRLGEGAAVEPRGVVFYAAGTARFEVPVDGALELWAAGTDPGGGVPWVWAEVPGRARVERPVPPAGGLVELGPVRAGDVVALSFVNDGVEPDGTDRNLRVGAVAVRPR